MQWKHLIFTLIALCLLSPAHAAEPNPLSRLAWQFGPGQGAIGDKATINIPKGYAFLGAEDTKKFMEMNQNIAGDNEYVLAPQSLTWFAIFHFNPVGYVKDNEKLDADTLLDTAKQGSIAANEERRKRGWRTMTIQGWRFPPQYDQKTKLLEWAFIARDDSNGQDTINYNTRLLGRKGVMEVILVTDPANLNTSVAALKTALTGYEYTPGEKYADYRQGDRVAEFGLAALVAGGAAAVAAKKGLFAVIAGFFAAAWKFIIAAVAGIGVWLKSLFRKKSQ